jgi:protein involved in polysaccharide export with SLBB domain
LVFSNSYAQIDQSDLLSVRSVGPSTSNYFFAKPNELTIIANVVGFVERPGRYEISKTIDLVNLIALAGGPTSDGALDDVRISRRMDMGGVIRVREIRVDLEDLSKVNPADLVLSPGDVIQIERTGWSTFRDAFGVVVSTAIIVGAVANVIWATRR